MNIIKKAGIDFRGLHYRKTPRGYSEDHPNSHFLRYNGVYMMETREISDEFYSLDLVEYAFDKFNVMDPLNHGFLKYTSYHDCLSF